MNPHKITVRIDAIRPMDPFLSRERLKNIDTRGIIVIPHHHDLWLAHGHHAAYHAWEQGHRDIEVIVHEHSMVIIQTDTGRHTHATA